jgi:hypothetical protein
MIRIAADEKIAEYFPRATGFTEAISIFWICYGQIKEFKHPPECRLHADGIAHSLRAACTRYFAPDVSKLQ